MAHKSYYPEMNETRPEGQIEAHLCHYGRHWFLKTPLTLKGRGIKFRGTFEPSERQPAFVQLKKGWNEYYVTERAFDRLAEQYDVVSEILLD